MASLMPPVPHSLTIETVLGFVRRTGVSLTSSISDTIRTLIDHAERGDKDPTSVSLVTSEEFAELQRIKAAAEELEEAFAALRRRYEASL